jgi:hypothetical protein
VLALSFGASNRDSGGNDRLPTLTVVAARILRIRYAGNCVSCGAYLPTKAYAYWDAGLRTLSCADCAGGPAEPGASAQREYERRHANDERRTRKKHPVIGGLLVAIGGDRQPTAAWRVGAAGEVRIGGMLEKLSEYGVTVVHDRRIPGSKANIDHIAIAPSGVYVIDTKAHKGLVTSRSSRGRFGPGGRRLYVSGRDCTKWITGMGKQLDAVRAALPQAAPPIRAIVCTVHAEWPLMASPIEIDGVKVMWPSRLRKTLSAPGPLSATTIRELKQHLAWGLPNA